MTPERIAHYRITGMIGAGGMGEVYRAEDTRLGRSVALKLLPPDVASDDERRQRFLREAQAAARLTHPNVATVYDVGESDARLYLAMELIDGKTLPERAGGRPLPIAEALEIGAQVADALDEAHRAGIVHRDIKPANVMVDARGRAKVLDFGVARLTSGSGGDGTATSYATRPGVVMGTLAYMSPEQVQAREVDGRSDIFSLGLVLYEMACGVPAFAGDVPTAVADRILHAQPDAIARFNYDAPAELDRIIRKCLEKDPARRYQSAHELVVDLRNLQRDLGVAHASGAMAPRPVGRNFSSAARRAVWIGAACLIAAVAIGITYWRGDAPWRRAAADPATPLDSIAVLPFTNMTARAENEYLGDGLAEEVINHLARSGRLRVVARSSTFGFKGKSLDVREIGRQLGVQAVLEGSVRQSGTRFRVTAQLVDASSGYHFWSETFDREASDILALQDEISRAIAQRLAPAAAIEVAALPAVSRTTNAEAYNHYLRALHAMGPWTKEGFRQAEEHLDRALALDPEFGAAWAAVAECAIMSHELHGVRARDDAYARASDAARRAIGVQRPAGEGHAALAHVLLHAYKWAAAEDECKQAIAMNPNSAIGLTWYGMMLHANGRFDEAERVLRRAVELDPLSPHSRAYLSLMLWAAGKLDEALTVAARATELGDTTSPYVEFAALVGLRRFDEARQVVARQRSTGMAAPAAELYTAYALAAEGKKEEAAALIARAERETSKAGTSAIPMLGAMFFQAYTAVGNVDAAVRHFDTTNTTDLDSFAYFTQYMPPVRALANDRRLTPLYRAAGLRASR